MNLGTQLLVEGCNMLENSFSQLFCIFRYVLSLDMFPTFFTQFFKSSVSNVIIYSIQVLFE